MQLIGFPTLIVGIIFWTVGESNHWFNGVGTVGEIMTIVSAAIIASCWLLMITIVGAALKRDPYTSLRRSRRKR